jgi:hypothetical protein
MAQPNQPPDATGHDPARVVELRRASLERAGFEPAAAAELAARIEIPLQEALTLVRAGLPPDVVLGMLASGERPVF